MEGTTHKVVAVLYMVKRPVIGSTSGRLGFIEKRVLKFENVILAEKWKTELPQRFSPQKQHKEEDEF